jgi:hypothetical protein
VFLIEPFAQFRANQHRSRRRLLGVSAGAALGTVALGGGRTAGSCTHRAGLFVPRSRLRNSG